MLARHGAGHALAPSQVNYRANIAALKAGGQNMQSEYNVIHVLSEYTVIHVLSEYNVIHVLSEYNVIHVLWSKVNLSSQLSDPPLF